MITLTDMEEKMFSVKNKIVIVTGGLGQIGFSFAQILANKEAKVVLLDIVSEKSAVKKLKELSGDVSYYQCNITDKKRLVKVRDAIIKKFGGIDVLINTAAIVHSPQNNKDNSFEALNLEDWNMEINTNITGTMLCCQIFGGAMKRGGSIVNLSSIYGIVAPDQRIYPKGYLQPITYGVTKGAIGALTRFLATYWGSKSIRVNCLAPGGIEKNHDFDFVKKYSNKTPLGRMAKLSDLSGVMLYLTSDASAYCTGATLVIDGGWTAW